jgi:AcrR family transcriptional regulator
LSIAALSGLLRTVRQKRTRRTAVEARAAILDAAEKRLLSVGPAGIRLQDVAADVGVSHPAVLHHFGSREALVEAVIQRAMGQLEAELVEVLTAQPIGEMEAADILERTFRVLGDRGWGRIMAWMLLSGHVPDERRQLAAIARAVHARRLQEHAGREAEPSYEDTLFSVLCGALAMFGDAVAGPAMRKSGGLPEKSAPRFRRWLAALLLDHLDRSPDGSDARP